MKASTPTGDATQKQDPDQVTLRETPTHQSRESRRTVEQNADTIQPTTSQSSSVGRTSFLSGLRHRNSTRRPQASQQERQPYASARTNDGKYLFTLAGPNAQNEENLARSQNQHQPYVEPGYADLNPAYDQPGNVRPIWGLADPMPRIVRRGMKPSAREIEVDKPKPGEEDKDVIQPTDSQLEKGIGPKLNLNKIDKNIKDATNERERNYAQKYGKKLEPPSEMGPESQTQPSDPFQELPPPREADEEREKADLGIPRPPVEPLNHDREEEEEDDHDKENEESDDDVMKDAHEQDEDDHVPINRIMEELHNNHTNWAVLRTKLREPLAEILGVMILVVFGTCANVAHNIANSGSNDSMAWAWGFGTMCGIYVAGGVSGGHLNPAVTIMLYIFRGFPKRKILVYVVAQLLGAYIGSLITYGIYRNYIVSFLGSDPSSVTTVYNSFVTNRVDGVADAASGFLTEFVATAFLGVIVLALGDDSNAPPGAGMNAFILGLVVAIEVTAFSANTGAALNPARDMGPRLTLITVGFSRHDLFGDGWWIYGAWCAPITGAIVGAILYDVAIFVGGESPINYPRNSVKRVGHKAGARWRHRFRRKER